MRTIVLWVLFVGLVLPAFGQEDSFKIEFAAKYGQKSFRLNKKIRISRDEKVVFDQLKFYVSNIRFFSDTVLLELKNQPFLVDLSTENFIQIQLPKNRLWTQISFDLGIDSATNVNGEMIDDLDPMNGMYWTWQSGFINFKMEGRSTQRKKQEEEFQYHIGGYRLPYYPLVNYNFPLNGQNELKLVFDLKKVIESAKASALQSVMSPGGNAVLFSEILKKSLMPSK